jgi:hypothetical protein
MLSQVVFVLKIKKSELSMLVAVAQVGLDQLDINALIKVLTEPKNAMVAQYHALFEMVCSNGSSRAVVTAGFQKDSAIFSLVGMGRVGEHSRTHPSRRRQDIVLID